MAGIAGVKNARKGPQAAAFQGEYSQGGDGLQLQARRFHL
jgi:hypothetical protein